MKIILSRKGFDSSNGSIPSPILPDGTLLSLPIPAKFDSISFDDLNYNGVLFSDILRQLKGKEDKTNHYNCHLDPDIRENLRNTPVSNWRAAFGQIKSSQGLLRNQNVSIGDLFLFFGWFRQTEGDIYNGTLHFKKDAPDLNIIYGYLQIGNMMAFLEYAMQVIISFLLLSMVFIMVPRAAVSVRRVGEVLDTMPSITDPKSPKKLPKDAKGKIEFKDVTFTYPDADLPVLSDINFVAEPGQTTAFIGSTGSGNRR